MIQTSAALSYSNKVQKIGGQTNSQIAYQTDRQTLRQSVRRIGRPTVSQTDGTVVMHVDRFAVRLVYR